MRAAVAAMRTPARRSLRWLALALLAIAGAAAADPVVLPPSQTGLSSTADRMISYRHQSHMWQTADRAMHVMVNTGTQATGAGLRLYTSINGGTSWIAGVALAASDANSTSDGFLDGDLLYLVHSTPTRSVVFTVLQYSPQAHAWSLIGAETAFASDTLQAINPALASDGLGRLWLGFIGRAIATGNYSVRLLRNASAEEGWVDTGFAFGAQDNLSIERSARPIATATGVGMVYTVHEKIFWAARENAWPLDATWDEQLLFTSEAGDQDPYASHFSIVADARHNLHMATVDGGRLLYLRYRIATGAWDQQWVTGDIDAGYPQVTLVPGSLVLTVNNGTQASVYQSRNGGNSFTETHRLVHGVAGAGISYANPRIETAERVLGPMLALQQFVVNGTQRLLLYRVPVIQSASDWTE